MGLYVEITGADGDVLELRDNAPAAEDRPQNIRFTTARGDGFKECTFTLARRVDDTYYTVRRYDRVRVLDDRTAEVAWEGYVNRVGKTMESVHETGVECVGPMGTAKDHKITELIIDRSLQRWGGPPLAERARQLGASIDLGSLSWETDQYGLACMLPNQALGARVIAIAWYQPPAGVFPARVLYRGSDVSVPSGWIAPRIIFAGANGDDAEIFNITLDSTARTVEQTGQRQHVYTDIYSNGTASTPASGAARRFDLMAVVGDHDLLLQGSDPTQSGPVVSDVIRYLLAKYCPLIKPDGILPTSLPLPHGVYERQFPYEILLNLNGLHRWGLEVWDDWVLHFAPPDLTVADWEISTNDELRPITTQFPGPADDEQPNGTVVSFTDPQGVAQIVTPVDDSRLAWPDPEHEATRHGREVWSETEITQISVRETAIEMGRVALADANQNRLPAVFGVLSGEILDAAGGAQPAWKARAGQTIALVSSVDDQPRLITETSWDNDSKRMTITVDNALSTFEGILERWTVALEAAGVSR